MFLVGRESHAIRIGAGILRQGGWQHPRRRDDRNGFEDGVGCGADDVDRVGLVFDNVEQRLGGVQGHLVGLAFYRDARRHRWSAVEADDVDLAVANAGDIGDGGGARSLDHHPKRILAARHTGLGGVGLTRAEIQLRWLGPIAVAACEDGDGIVVVIGDD